MVKVYFYKHGILKSCPRGQNILFLMFSQNKSLQRNRRESIGTKFLELAPKNLIIFANFSLKSTEYVQMLLKTMKNTSNSPIEMFFVCEELSLNHSFNSANYLAAFAQFTGAKEHVQRFFSQIRFCQVNQLSLLSVEKLFTIMCETSFIQVDFFQRLGMADIKVIKRTTNPFVQVFLYKNVSYFTNLETANRFISQELSNVLSVSSLLAKRKQLTSEQKNISKMLFGLIKKDMIHLTNRDQVLLITLYQKLKKYEVKNEDDMLDEDQQFENVSYCPFQQNESEFLEQYQMLNNLKKRRERSIQEMRDRLKDQEKHLNRWDTSQRIRL